SWSGRAFGPEGVRAAIPGFRASRSLQAARAASLAVRQRRRDPVSPNIPERSAAMSHSPDINRREFLGSGAALGAAVGLAGVAAADEPARGRVGGVGCGSGAHADLPHPAKCRHVELVSACDIIPERAKRQAEKFRIPNQYPHIDQLLAGAAFDLLVNLTDMQEHEHLNRQAVEAGKHVWSEKPLANSLAA